MVWIEGRRIRISRGDSARIRIEMEDGGQLEGAQAVVTLARVAGADLSSPYGDVSASPYYYEAVEWAKDSGVASGEIENFRPDDAATRAEDPPMRMDPPLLLTQRAQRLPYRRI